MTQRANFVPFMSNQVISNFPLFFSSLFFLFPFLSNSSRIFSPKDTKPQAAVIFTSLQNAKFTSIVGYTSRRPTYIESFMTIFGQCINVLNYKTHYQGATIHGNSILIISSCKTTTNHETFTF